MFNHNEFGLWGESRAQKFLKAKKLKVLQSNFETKSGEIDIVCLQTVRAAKWQLKQLLKEEKRENSDFLKTEIRKQIAQKQYESKEDLLVFVEVKTRSQKSAVFLRPQNAVDTAKQNKYQLLANAYASKNQLELPTRFDIVEVVEEDAKAKINHIENAF